MRRRVAAGVGVVLVLAVAIVWFGLSRGGGGGSPSPSTGAPAASSSASAAPPATDIRALFDAHRSGVEVDGSGTVTRILADDDDGSRHQRFILRLTAGLTVLVAHNMDIAPRLDGLRTGDRVEFHGQYEWSEQGGTVHWTHHDPAGRHENGWLRWNGDAYG